MQYLIGAIGMWVILSWTLYIVDIVLNSRIFTDNKILWIVFAPMLILLLLFIPVSIYLENKYKKKE